MSKLVSKILSSLPRQRNGKSNRARALSLLAVLGMALLILDPLSAHAASRIKDIADFEGVRDNMLVGYGLVVGLNGTGDSMTNAPFTERSLIGMLERLGINSSGDFSTIQVKNIAAVMVTATLPPFSEAGSRIDVSVGAMGDAKSLQGGILLVTPLQGADGEIYAVAQGSISSGIKASGQGTSVTKGVPTSGRIAGGGIVERAIDFHLSDLGTMNLALRNPDFTTAQRIADAINKHLKAQLAQPVDSATVRLAVPPEKRNSMVALMTEIEQLSVTPDEVAKVVIDEANGIIVMGENVHINTVAIAQGNLTIRITETPQVSQPGPLSEGGTTVVVPRTQISVDEEKDNKLAVFNKGGVSLQQLVQGLNALGIGPRDMIAILQSIKAAGALQAELEVI